jgi:hypothetical protein
LQYYKNKMQNNVKAAKVIIVVKVFRNTHTESQKAKNIVQQQPINLLRAPNFYVKRHSL